MGLKLKNNMGCGVMLPYPQEKFFKDPVVAHIQFIIGIFQKWNFKDVDGSVT